jgi:type I restriction enzyme S subunit
MGLGSRARGVTIPRHCEFCVRHLPAAAKVRSTPFQWELQVRSKGVWISRLQLTDEAFLGAPFPLPPTGEQAAIARYLAHIDRRVRRYIRAKQKLIALLNEQKQAIIHQAVTRGLDPNVRLKPSGVEWFQSIPNHWRVAKLATLALKIGDGLHGTPKYVDESDCHFINGNNLADGVIRITPSTRCVDAEELKKYQTDLGDTTLLMSINGTIGNLALYRGESVVLGKSAAYINCADTLSRDYLFFFLQSRSVANYCQDEVTGTTIVNLSLASIRSLPIALPPLDEQLRISKYLSQARESCNRVINSVVCEIERLREYRTRLVADVVTGKLDVREAAAALPEEVEAAEALEEDEAPADEEAAFDEIEAEADTAENSA